MFYEKHQISHNPRDETDIETKPHVSFSENVSHQSLRGRTASESDEVKREWPKIVRTYSTFY